MTASTRFSLSTILSIVFSLLALSALAQDKQVAAPSAVALAMELHSGDAYRIADAIGHIPRNGTKEGMAEFRRSVDPLVADGLIAALEDQLDELLSTYEGNYDAYPIEDLLDPLMFFVAALEDERTIPLLLDCSQFGGEASLALGAFGPRIFPVILDYIESSERTVEEIKGGFLALTRTVERLRPLDSSTHATLRKLSIRYLQGYTPEYLKNDSSAYTINRMVMNLASSLGDADLKPMVAAFASKHPGFVEMYLERWYDGPSGAVQQDQIDLND